MPTFISRTFPELVQINTPDGRFYKVPSGDIFPSVSTVCGFQAKATIQNWKNKVGEEAALKISSRASKRGTGIHSLCEQHLRTGEANPDIFDRELFNTLIPYLNAIDNIEAIEQPLYSELMKVAGTVDLIATLNGVPSIIDFKTSSRVKSREQISSYFCQTFCYGQSYYELTGIKINQLVVIMGIDDNPAKVFIERSRDWRNAALQLREDYRSATGF